MHSRLRYLSLAATTLLLAVTSPLLPLTSHLAPLRAQAQTAQDRNAEALRLNEEGVQRFSFNGLLFAGTEVENLATALPSTTKLLDKAFSREGTVPRMNDYNIVHLITHAALQTDKMTK
jgi:CHAT domain-containing protein